MNSTSNIPAAGYRGRNTWEPDPAFPGKESAAAIRPPQNLKIKQWGPNPASTTQATVWGVPAPGLRSTKSMAPMPSYETALALQHHQTRRHADQASDAEAALAAEAADRVLAERGPRSGRSSSDRAPSEAPPTASPSGDKAMHAGVTFTEEQAPPPEAAPVKMSAYDMFKETPQQAKERAAAQRAKVYKAGVNLPPALPSLNPFKPLEHPVELGMQRRMATIFADINAANVDRAKKYGPKSTSARRIVSARVTNIRGAMLQSKGKADDTTIPIEDVPDFIERMGEPFSPDDIQMALAEIEGLDQDGDGQIELGQMVKSWPALKRRLENRLANEMPEQVIAALNEVRRDPQAYAEKLKKRHQYFVGKRYQLPGDREPTLTSEGWIGVQSLINDLMATPPMAPLQNAYGLCRAAEFHACDAGRHSLISHVGSNNHNPIQRVERFGHWLFENEGGGAADDKMAENMTFGGRSVDQHVYVNLVDDGLRSRQHRKNILDRNMTYVGVGLATHKALGTVCVINFSHDWQDKDERDMPPRPLRTTNPDAVPNYLETQAAKKLQAAYKRRLAMKIRKGMIEDEALVQAGLATVLQAGYPFPISFEFRQAMFKAPWKVQEYGNRALLNKRTTVRLTLQADSITMKSWGGGMDAIIVAPTVRRGPRA
mmetsp:Transcript_78170/g.137986  ORF Transcript_78170/g.137986 Transcript_78170/m.137986 type:complete len:657 (-) Transcript_78170:97-2067(-)